MEAPDLAEPDTSDIGRLVIFGSESWTNETHWKPIALSDRSCSRVWWYSLIHAASTAVACLDLLAH